MRVMATLYMSDVRDIDALRAELRKLVPFHGNIEEVDVAAPLPPGKGRASQLRFAQHAKSPNEGVCEIWYRGEFVGQITGADMAGVRIATKYDIEVIHIVTGDVQVVEVRIHPE